MRATVGPRAYASTLGAPAGTRATGCTSSRRSRSLPTSSTTSSAGSPRASQPPPRSDPARRRRLRCAPAPSRNVLLRRRARQPQARASRNCCMISRADWAPRGTYACQFDAGYKLALTHSHTTLAIGLSFTLGLCLRDCGGCMDREMSEDQGENARTFVSMSRSNFPREPSSYTVHIYPQHPSIPLFTRDSVNIESPA